MKDTKKMKQQKKTVAHKVGDAVERVGQKLSEAGAKKVGAKVYRAGNKIEHSQDEE